MDASKKVNGKRRLTFLFALFGRLSGSWLSLGRPRLFLLLGLLFLVAEAESGRQSQVHRLVVHFVVHFLLRALLLLFQLSLLLVALRDKD